jgi:hypothetical protein
VIAKLQEKEKLVIFKPKLDITVWERTKIVHNPDLLKNSLVFL